jgi:HD-like signal output (HDOD) protein
MTTAFADSASLDELARSIRIPPRPAVLLEIETELKNPDPDPRRIAASIGRDVALSAALVKTANSPFFGLARKVESVDQAVSYIGLIPTSTLVMGLVLRGSLGIKGAAMERFWDLSCKRALAARKIAQLSHKVNPELAHSLGLFMDCGIALLMNNFKDYKDVLAAAYNTVDEPFTAPEQARYKTDHAQAGALLVRSWGLSTSMVAAVRGHHDYTLLAPDHAPLEVQRLIALGLIADRAVGLYQGITDSCEWNKGCDIAMNALEACEPDVAEWIDLVHEALLAEGELPQHE